ncbi:putative mitochondrial import protein TIM15 [Dioscorea sansibarensis]
MDAVILAKPLIPMACAYTEARLTSSSFLSFPVSTPRIALLSMRMPLLKRRDKIGFCLKASNSEENHASHSSFSSPSSAKVAFDIKLPRRSLLVQFTCNACGERTQRMVNRVAYERGTVFVQCAGCLVNHKLVDNLGLVVEYDLREEVNADSGDDRSSDGSGATGAGGLSTTGAGAGACFFLCFLFLCFFFPFAGAGAGASTVGDGATAGTATVGAGTGAGITGGRAGGEGSGGDTGGNEGGGGKGGGRVGAGRGGGGVGAGKGGGSVGGGDVGGGKGVVAACGGGVEEGGNGCATGAGSVVGGVATGGVCCSNGALAGT